MGIEPASLRAVIYIYIIGIILAPSFSDEVRKMSETQASSFRCVDSVSYLVWKFFKPQYVLCCTADIKSLQRIKTSCCCQKPSYIQCLWKPSRCVNYQIQYTYSAEYKTGLFRVSYAFSGMLHVRPFLRPSSGLWIQKSHKGKCNKIKPKGLHFKIFLFTSSFVRFFINMPDDGLRKGRNM